MGEEGKKRSRREGASVKMVEVRRYRRTATFCVSFFRNFQAAETSVGINAALVTFPSSLLPPSPFLLLPSSLLPTSPFLPFPRARSASFLLALPTLGTSWLLLNPRLSWNSASLISLLATLPWSQSRIRCFNFLIFLLVFFSVSSTITSSSTFALDIPSSSFSPISLLFCSFISFLLFTLLVSALPCALSRRLVAKAGAADWGEGGVLRALEQEGVLEQGTGEEGGGEAGRLRLPSPFLFFLGGSPSSPNLLGWA